MPISRLALLGVLASLLALLSSCGDKDRVELQYDEVIDLKRAQKVEEVWVHGQQVTVKLTESIVRDGKPYSKAYATIPGVYQNLPEQLRELTEGLQADKVHWE